MADGKEREGIGPGNPGGGGPEKPLPQEDRIFARLVGDPTLALAGLTSYFGLLVRSPTEGRWRLYFSLDMSVYVEVREEDVVYSEQLAAEKSPFGGLGGTQIYVKKGAEVTTTQIVSRTLEAGGAEDEFDLDIRLGGPAGLAAAPMVPVSLVGPICVTGTCQTCQTQCHQNTCQTCYTQCHQNTCQTCQTQCQQNTCAGTCQTCQTQCHQNTCQTCYTQCHQNTCNTCDTKCGQPTCVGVATCHTCPDLSCVACTHVTCYAGCGGV